MIPNPIIPNDFGRPPSHRFSFSWDEPRPTVEERKGISIFELKQGGIFDKLHVEAQYGFRYGDLQLVLVRGIPEELDWYLQIANYGPKNGSSVINLQMACCKYGGWRFWFECQRCERRCGILYEHNDNYECRQCLNLGYDSQRVNYKTVEPFLVRVKKFENVDLHQVIKYQTYRGRPKKRAKRKEKLMNQIEFGAAVFGKFR